MDEICTTWPISESRIDASRGMKREKASERQAVREREEKISPRKTFSERVGMINLRTQKQLHCNDKRFQISLSLQKSEKLTRFTFFLP